MPSPRPILTRAESPSRRRRRRFAGPLGGRLLDCSDSGDGTDAESGDLSAAAAGMRGQRERPTSTNADCCRRRFPRDSRLSARPRPRD